MNRNQKVSTIDLKYIARKLIQNTFIILLCGWIGCLCGFMSADLPIPHSYTSTAFLFVRNKDNPEKILSDPNAFRVVTQFQDSFNSDVMMNTVKEVLGVDSLDGELHTQAIENANILIVRATAKQPVRAFNLVKAAIHNYQKVTDYLINTYFLETFMNPTIPTHYDAALGHIKLSIIGGILGILLSAASVIIFVMLRDDIKNESQVEQLLDADKFATVYYEKKRGKNKKKGILISDPKVSFLYRENIQKLAVKLNYEAARKDVKTIMITSVQENEGKSTIAANLALALANLNNKVLLIDADLRNPSMYRLFEKQLDKDQEIGNFLSGKAPMQTILTKDGKSGLFYLFGTNIYRNSDKMLRTQEMEDLLRIARMKMDYIIIDTAPMSVNNDAEILCKYIDGALMIVRQGWSRVTAINEALDTLNENEVEVLGCVYNAAQTKVSPLSSEKGYHYGYGADRGYTRGAYGSGRSIKTEKSAANQVQHERRSRREK